MASWVRQERRLSWTQPGGRVLVIRPGALGDTLVALPAVRDLRSAVGGAGEVDWVGYPRYLELACNPLHASSALSVDRMIFSGLFSGTSSRELEEFLSGYDLVAAWCRDDAGRLRSLLHCLDVPLIQSDPYPPAGSGIHATDHLLGTMERQTGSIGDCKPGRARPVLVLSDESQKAGGDFLRRSGLRPDGFIAIHPGSGSVQKNWQPVNFARVAQSADRASLAVLVIEGEADEEPVRAMLEHLETRTVILRTQDLQVVAHLLSQSSAYLGNDSGISHLAAASGAPTIALFGPTDPRTWAPRGRKVRILGLHNSADDVWSAIQEVCP